jgi:hypothetical protein
LSESKDFVFPRLFSVGFIIATGILLFSAFSGLDLLRLEEVYYFPGFPTRFYYNSGAYFNFRAFFRIRLDAISILGDILKTGADETLVFSKRPTGP